MLKCFTADAQNVPVNRFIFVRIAPVLSCFADIQVIEPNCCGRHFTIGKKCDRQYRKCQKF